MLQQQHQRGGRLLALINIRPLLGVVTNTVLTSQVTSTEHSTDNIQAQDDSTPGGAAL